MLCCDLLGQVTSLAAPIPQVTTRRLVWPCVPKRNCVTHPKTKRTVQGPASLITISLQTMAEFPLPSGENSPCPSHCPMPLIFSVTERSYFWLGKVKVRAGPGEEGRQLQSPALKSLWAGTHVETSKALLSKLTLKEDPELGFYGGKIFPEEGFITPQKASATCLGPFSAVNSAPSPHSRLSVVPCLL